MGDRVLIQLPLESIHVTIENRKRYWLRCGEIVAAAVMLAVAISWAFENRWIASAAAAFNAIFWMTKHLRDSASVISVITLDESRLVNGHPGG